MKRTLTATVIALSLLSTQGALAASIEPPLIIEDATSSSSGTAIVAALAILMAIAVAAD